MEYEIPNQTTHLQCAFCIIPSLFWSSPPFSAAAEILPIKSTNLEKWGVISLEILHVFLRWLQFLQKIFNTELLGRAKHCTFFPLVMNKLKKANWKKTWIYSVAIEKAKSLVMSSGEIAPCRRSHCSVVYLIRTLQWTKEHSCGENEPETSTSGLLRWMRLIIQTLPATLRALLFHVLLNYLRKIGHQCGKILSAIGAFYTTSSYLPTSSKVHPQLTARWS